MSRTSKIPYVRIVGLVVAIGAGFVAFEYFRSPIIGILTVLGMVTAGLARSNRAGGAVVILVAAAAIAAGSAPQVAHANGGPFPRWYRLAVPTGCKAVGNPEPDRYGAWWIDPAYKACLDNSGPDWMARCAIGAAVGPVANLSGMAMTSRSWAMYASKLADFNPWGLLVVAGTGCVLAQIKTG